MAAIALSDATVCWPSSAARSRPEASCMMTASPKPFTIRWKADSASWLRCAAGNSAADVARSDVRASRPWNWPNAVDST